MVEKLSVDLDMLLIAVTFCRFVKVKCFEYLLKDKDIVAVLI